MSAGTDHLHARVVLLIQGDEPLPKHSGPEVLGAKAWNLARMAALGMPVGSIGPTRGRCLATLRAALSNDPRWSMS